jgi:hypothetical protein
MIHSAAIGRNQRQAAKWRNNVAQGASPGFAAPTPRPALRDIPLPRAGDARRMRRGREGFYRNPGLPPWAILFRPFGPRKSSHGDENLGDSSTPSQHTSEEPVRRLLEAAIDYAGIFPPAALTTARAVDEYDAFRAGPFSWLSGCLVAPVARLEELSDALSGRASGVPSRVTLDNIVPRATPSPGPRRLEKTPAAVHPLPQGGEGLVNNCAGTGIALRSPA